MDDRPAQPDDSADTTIHVRRALDGDRASLDWIVAHFSPLLLAQARYRLGDTLKNLYDPEDLVSETWAVALPRLPELPPRDGRHTPVLLRFLGTTLLYRFNNLLRKHLGGKPKQKRGSEGVSSEADPLAALPADVSGVVSKALRHEAKGVVGESIDRLGEEDREIVILRGIEQNSPEEVAALLGIPQPHVNVRYHRALKKLRVLLPASVFDEFPGEEE